MMQLALALDLGTTTVTGLAVSPEGRVLGRVTRANSSSIAGLPDGHAEQDPALLRRLAFDVLRELATTAPGMPHCLGLTGQMHGTLLLDRNRNPLSRLITWQDRRTALSTSEEEASPLDRLLARCGTDDLARTGCRLAPGYLGATLAFLKQHRQIPGGMHQAAFLADWIAAELCDVPPVTDRSNAASSGMFDLERDQWSEPLLAAAELPREWLPDVRDSGAVIGLLTPESAAATGLPAGLPVCNAMGDNQAAVLGSVPAGEPAIQINVGTGGQINWTVPEFIRIPGMETRSLPHARFMLVGAGLVGGDAYAWVQRTARSWIAALGFDAAPEAIYAKMNSLAAAISTTNDGLQCDPKFRGTRQHPQARGRFGNVTSDNFSLGHVARAVLQGIADGMYWFYKQAGESQPHAIRRIVGSGNGLRENPLLAQILAKTFERDVFMTEHPEEAAYGAALLAGAATGLWPSLESAGRVIQHVKSASPKP